MTESIAVSFNLLMKTTPSLLRKLVACYQKYKAKLLIVPYDELKQAIVKYLNDSQYIVFDLDHPEAYIESDDEDITRFTQHPISRKRVIKKLIEYTSELFREDGDIVIYVCSSIDNIRLFKQRCVYVFKPSDVYLSLEGIHKDELFNLKIDTAPLKKNNILLFSNKTDALTELSKRICKK